MKIKRILLPIAAALCFSCLPTTAQNAPEAKKNALRAGAGVNIIFGSSTSYGCATRIEYGHKITKHFEVAADIQLSANHIDLFDKHVSGIYCFGISPKIIFTPFPKAFRYIRIGASVSWYHAQNFFPASQESFIYDADGVLDCVCLYQKGGIVNYERFGFNGFARIYAVDNDRFELFLNWDPTFYIIHGTVYNFGYNTTVNFGIKF